MATQRRPPNATARPSSSGPRTAPRRRRRWPLVLGLLVLLLIGFAFAAWLGNRRVLPDRPPQQVKVSAEDLERGRYLTRAADCAACHQTADGAAFAGGTPLKTPFGTIYGTNITPDADHGIGRWSAEEFYRAVTLGKAPGGRNLYPAMPYVSYHAMTREDSALIHAYLMNLRPIPQENRPPDVPFPFNLRILLSGWNLLFFDKDPLPAASAGDSADWKRGAYLGNVLGHCGACHTPRGGLGQLKRGEWLRGYALNQYLAPSLTPQELQARGWTAGDLQGFMKSGIAPQGNAFDEMLPVILHSTQYLSAQDLGAIATFLLGDAASGRAAAANAAAPAAAPAPQPLDMAGRRQYLALCAGCHGVAGEGIAHTMPSLQTSSTVRDANPRNLVLLSLHGLPAQRFPDSARSAMPGFARQLDDGEIAAIANYCRTAWGRQPGDVTAGAVAKLRQLK